MKLKYFCICSKLRTLCLLRLIKEKVNIKEVVGFKSTTITENISLFPVYSDPTIFNWKPLTESNYNLVGVKGKSETGFLFLYNIIAPNLKLLSKEWFIYCSDFKEGYARVNRLGWNWIGKDGKILSKYWYLECSEFYKGIARVRSNRDKYNFIKKDGQLLSKEWFLYCDTFSDFNKDYAEVITKQGDHKWIDRNGNLYSEKPM